MEEELERDMKPKLIKDLGMRYATKGSTQRRSFGLYECQYCGKEWECMTVSIKNKHTKSCGCLGGVTTHGLESNRFYSTWNNMSKRCNNPNSKDFINYGGRGITVCADWLDIRNFVAWCEETYPNIEGLSLDRIDNDKGYSPENCTWSSRTMQNINQRMKITNTSGYNGIIWNKKNSNWVAVIGIATKKVYIGSFKIKEEAVQARDKYITQNNLPHKLSTDYKREES